MFASPINYFFLQRLFVRVIAYFSPQRIILTYNPHIVSTDQAEVCCRFVIMCDNFNIYCVG